MRRTRSLFHSGCLLAIMLVSALPCFAQTTDHFAQGNQEFGQGKFKEAVANYNSLVQAGDFSANLFYNLGNAHFRLEDFGAAILNYERVLALEPRHPEALANLRIARDEARALELPPGWAERLLRFGDRNQYTAAASVLFWLGAFILVARIFARRRSRGLVALGFLALVLSVSLGVAIFFIDRGNTGRSLAIVTKREANARLATADNAGTVLALPAGSEVRVIRRRGDWVYAALPNNLMGWIPAGSLEIVRL